MDDVPMRFPKVKSPFNRSENVFGEYVVYDEVNPTVEWAFDESVEVVEKLDGTNCAIEINGATDGGRPNVSNVFTRHGTEAFRSVSPYSYNSLDQSIVRAAQNAMRRGFLSDLSVGVHYGEAVGPSFQGNPHELDEDLFVPFSWLGENCAYSANQLPDAMTYEALSDWMQDDLPSLFQCVVQGVPPSAVTVSEGTFCEGVMFVHPHNSYTQPGLACEQEVLDDGTTRMVSTTLAKLRVDMWDWFEGERH